MKAMICLLFTVVVSLPLLAEISKPIDLPAVQAKVDKGDPEAELELGRAYHLGRGVPKDFAKALDLYQKSAAQGNAKAMFNIGYLYSHAQGVKVDNQAALDWFRKAADKKLPAAELKLGMLYQFGENGVEKDYPTAIKYLTLAAAHEDAPEQVGPACNALGNIYEQGLGVPVDGKVAFDWYKKGAEAGYGKAQGTTGRFYYEGLYVKKDCAQSYMWLKLASLQGDIMSLHLLGDYISGKQLNQKQMEEGDRLVLERQKQKISSSAKPSSSDSPATTSEK